MQVVHRGALDFHGGKVADPERPTCPTESEFEQVAAIQAESRLAASVIHDLLRHVSPSDVFTIRDDVTAARNGETPQ